jgi:integrase
MPGQIVAQGKRSWLVRIFLGRGDDGKREYLNKTIHGAKRDAEKWLTATLRDRDMGGAIEPAAMPLNDFLDKWLDVAAKGKVKPQTFQGYGDVLRRYIRPELGRRPLGKLGPLEIQAVYNRLLGEGFSPRTIQYTNMILKQALEQAVNWRLLFHNPCRAVKVPRQERKEMAAFDPSQARRFLAAAREDRHGVAFELALTSGLRPSEYLALKWPDLNPEKGTLTVNRSIDFLPGGAWQFADNKTGRSRRTVKLHSNVVVSLLEHKRRQEAERHAAGDKWTEHGLVFTNETGGPLDRHNLLQRHFRPTLKRAGLPASVRLYDLRHTAATLALLAGVPVKVVSEMLGHATISLTLDTYAHVLPHMQEDAAAKVEALLMGPAITAPTVKRHSIGTDRPN